MKRASKQLRVRREFRLKTHSPRRAVSSASDLFRVPPSDLCLLASDILLTPRFLDQFRVNPTKSNLIQPKKINFPARLSSLLLNPPLSVFIRVHPWLKWF